MARYYRKIIRITAEDSPNVRYAQAQIKAGKVPTGEMLVPGVLPWDDYVKRRATWDSIRQTIGLDAQFYKGAELLLFPPQWLNLSAYRANTLWGKKRQAEAIGVDPAEGGDKTAYCVVDRYGVMALISKKTPNTYMIPGDIKALIRYYNVDPNKVVFDAGGGGKIHVDSLRQEGYPVRTVRFGESVAPTDGERRRKFDKRRIDDKEERYVYRNRRAQMYGELSILLDPNSPRDEGQFAIPPGFMELRRQLAPIPKTYDKEERLVLLPKHKPKGSTQKCLTDIIGCSPDEADSLVLAVYGMLHNVAAQRIGGF